MDAKKRITATLAGFVVLFIMGWLLYGMLLMDFFQSNSGTATGVVREETDMVWWALIGGNILQAYLLVYVFGKWANINTFAGGFQNGLVLGLIWGYAYDLTTYGTTNITNLTGALVDPLVMGIMMATAGGVIGWMLGKK